jgi:hypothetical protein
VRLRYSLYLIGEGVQRLLWYTKIGHKWTKYLVVLVFFLGFCSNAPERESIWIKIDNGLHYSEFKAPVKSDIGDSKILILKVDPREYGFVLLCASEQTGGQALNVKEWTGRYGLIAAINAGMFQKDLKSNVGYMKNYTHLNNPRIHKTYASIFAFNPMETGLPPARIFDADVDKTKEVIAGYHTIIQNLRLIKRPGLNRWFRQDRRWSEAALGQDQDGNLLFIFCESPYSMHDLGNFLLGLPIGIDCAQHLEGGIQASFYLRHNKAEISRVGRYKTSSVMNNPNGLLFPIPNIIGIKKKN